MLKVLRISEPSVDQWLNALDGMRNSYQSWQKGDSTYCYGETGGVNLNLDRDCTPCPYYEKVCASYDIDDYEEWCLYDLGDEGFPTLVIGQNDLDLLMKLVKEGSSNRKILRHLNVMTTIRAPLYFWKQLDTYKVGTSTSSESTMHSILNKPFEISDFSFEYALTPEEVFDYNPDVEEFRYSVDVKRQVEDLVYTLNRLRDEYFELEGWKKRFEDGDVDYENFMKDFSWKKLFTDRLGESYFEEFTKGELIRLTEDLMECVWTTIIQLLPESYNQTRLFTCSMETMIKIAQERIDHKLIEWRRLIAQWILSVPYYKEILSELGTIRIVEKPVKDLFIGGPGSLRSVEIFYHDRHKKRDDILYSDFAHGVPFPYEGCDDKDRPN